MARPIVMPSLGMYTAEGTLTNWLKADGDNIAPGEVVAEITTEKATYEIEAPTEGRLHIVASIGATLEVQGVLGYLLEPGEAPPLVPTAAPTPPTNTASPAAPAAPPSAAAASTTAAPSTASAGERGQAPATPVARRLAAQHGIDLTRLTGSGPGGRIVEADVQAAITAQAGQASASTSTPGAAAPAASTTTESAPLAATGPGAPGGPAERLRQRIPLIGIRRTIGERLRQSLQTAVPVTLTRETEAATLVEARTRLGERLGRAVPYDAIFAAVLAQALTDLPTFNATIQDDAILVYKEVHVGVAVATSVGLLVPVIRSVQSRPLAEIAAAVTELGERARAGRLSADEMMGGTATLTNLGASGVDTFTPILNPPQAVILGIGRIRPTPTVVYGQLLLQPTCHLSLTFDHRVADGAPAAELLGTIARLMNDRAWLMGLA